ncbi:PIR protein CIR protein [Plasmodium vinckei lentum]|uniref:PIR protein CIR protein n=1 Tax=Plasmodium vinckei lentum TaxID=138297 RepID=A0A6V7S5K9_PLAVN|nr:PIR protein CIR protein [Plasmodium vinckei lentum]
MESCNTFNDIDELFINDGSNEKQFSNKDGLYNKYCPGKSGSKRCETDYEKLIAIFGHAYTELMQNNMIDLDNENDPTADFLVMALSHRLYKLSNDHTLSLKNAFKKYLNNQGGFNYSSVLRNKKYFNGSNIGIINCFYLAFKQICETVNKYGKSKVQRDEYIRVIARCYIIYDKLYNFVNQCSPYSQLLNHLKAIYDELKKAVIKFNDYDQTLRNQIMDLSSIDKTMFGFEFNTIGCKKVHKKLEKNISRIVSKSQEEQDEFNTLTELLGSDDGDAEDDDENGGLGNDNIPTNSLNKDQNGQQGTPTASKLTYEKSPPTPPQVPQKPGTDPQSGTKDSDKGSDPSKSEKRGLENQKGNSGSEGDGSGRQGDSSNQGGSVGGPKESGDQTPSYSLGASNEYLPRNWGISFNLMSYISSVSDIYRAQKDILTNVTNQVSNAYNSAIIIAKDTYDSTVTAVKNTYDSTVTTIKDAYSATTNYIGDTVSSIISQLNSFSTFSQVDDDQSGSGGSGNNLPTDNNTLRTTQIPNPDPSPPPLPSSSTPPGTTTSPSPTSPDTAPTISQPQSGPTQDSSQITDQNGGSDPAQSYDTNTGTGVPKALTSSSTDPSIQGSGITAGTVVKMSEKLSIWCIGSNKKCDILGIGIIGISIFVFLAIMYKYISFGSAKNSKKKKSMKRVIKLVDGNRKTQIIINSYDRNKDLKPVINSVGRKKDPLLNIYKLMQADPVPFINLFFLLIFFVYKKKFII